MTEINQIINLLSDTGTPEELEKMQRIGINTQNAFGVNLTQLRIIAKPYKNQHELALALWDSNYHEAKILATIIEDPKQVTKKQISNWAADFYSWDICDLCCRNLLENTSYVNELITRWSKCKRIFLKRAAFVLIARQAKINKKMSNKRFIHYLTIIEKNSTDDRNYVKKAVSWALRQIGKRNIELKHEADIIVKHLLQKTDKASKWIAQNYIAEMGLSDD